MKPIRSANKSRKRRRETDRSATTRTRVGGVLSMSYHSCSGKDPQLSKGPPTARCSKSSLYSMYRAYPLSIKGEKKRKRERGLYWRGFAPEIGAEVYSGLCFRKDEDAKGKEKVSFEQPTWHKDSSSPTLSRWGFSGGEKRHSTSIKQHQEQSHTMPSGESSDDFHECCPRGRVQEGLFQFLSTWCPSTERGVKTPWRLWPNE